MLINAIAFLITFNNFNLINVWPNLLKNTFLKRGKNKPYIKFLLLIANTRSKIAFIYRINLYKMHTNNFYIRYDRDIT